MKAYIKATGCISAQETLYTEGFPEEIYSYHQPYLKSIDPDYKKFVSPGAARRMGRIIKMGVAASMVCLNKAEVTNPGAIIIGTGMGCVEDTERFLIRMIENNEQLLTPTSFIQSTHNTVGGQIALLLGCNNYNFTYVHRGFSFESALLDGLMLLQEGEESVLVGGVDELTENHFSIYKKLGHWKDNENNLTSLNSETTGTIPGEGSAFFLLRNKPGGNDTACIDDLGLIYNYTNEILKSKTLSFLEKNNLKPEDIDLVVAGVNGHKGEDPFHYNLLKSVFPETSVAAFKHLSGDYPTASAFGLWFSAQAIKVQSVPDICWLSQKRPEKVKRILFCNNFRDNYYSLTLLSQC